MLTLTSGESSIVVAPHYGAALTGWMLGRTPLLRRALPQATIGGNCHTMGCFPLLPYCNRISHGRFHWHGAEYRVAPNFGDHPHTIHGVGWQSAWTVLQAGPGSATLALEHAAGRSWPFAFSARVTYTLSGAGLAVSIQLTNRHAAPAPAGIGLHPYFPRANDPSLQFHIAGAWENGADALPLRHIRPPADWLHMPPRRVVGSRLDNCFTGWDGTAAFQAGPASLRIEATAAFRQLQVFTPSWADFFCVEPVSHIPDAINRPELPADQAMHVLQPDETLGGTVNLLPTTW